MAAAGPPAPPPRRAAQPPPLTHPPAPALNALTRTAHRCPRSPPAHHHRRRPTATATTTAVVGSSPLPPSPQPQPLPARSRCRGVARCRDGGCRRTRARHATRVDGGKEERWGEAVGTTPARVR